MVDRNGPDIKAPRKRGRAPVVPLVIAGNAPPVFVAPVAAPVEALVLPEMIVAATPVSIDPAPVVATPAAAPAVAEIESEPARADAAVAEPAPAPADADQPALRPEPAPTVASSSVQASNKGTIDMASTFQPAAAETTEKAKAVLGDFNNRAKATMEKSVKMGEEMTEMTKGNVEALVQSGRVAAKGVEQLAQDAAETAKKNFEAASATMKSFASVKSPTELFQLQSDAAKSYFDTAVADFSKFTEQLIKLAGDVAQPLSSRYSVAMDKVKTTTSL